MALYRDVDPLVTAKRVFNVIVITNDQQTGFAARLVLDEGLIQQTELLTGEDGEDVAEALENLLVRTANNISSEEYASWEMARQW